jgi:hypothetical protein
MREKTILIRTGWLQLRGVLHVVLPGVRHQNCGVEVVYPPVGADHRQRLA